MRQADFEAKEDEKLHPLHGDKRCGLFEPRHGAASRVGRLSVQVVISSSCCDH